MQALTMDWFGSRACYHDFMSEKKKPPKFVCHICGLKIDPGIVDPNHPIFLTVDHVIPRSKNGPDHASNRKPAHRIYNNTRGNRNITEALRIICRNLAQNSIHAVVYPKRALPPKKEKWRVYRDKKTRAWIAKWKFKKYSYRTWGDAMNHVLRAEEARGAVS